MTQVPAFRLERHQSLPSTSDLCIDRAEAGEPAGLAVLALRQTRGRGSRGRSWFDRDGNLALSVLLRPRNVPITVWPFVAALALHDGLSAQAASGTERLTLKWPNDVLIDGRKLAGILVESGAQAGWVVIGMGANLAGAPDVQGRDPGCLMSLMPPDGTAPAPEAVAARVLDSLSYWIGVQEAEGFEPIREAWLTRAHPQGTALAVSAPGVDTRGSFAGLDRDGALLLEVAGERRRIATGDVLQLNEEPL